MWLPHSIKSFFFNYHLKQFLKTNSLIRETVSLNDAKNIGILFNATTTGNFASIHPLELELKEMGKKVSVLGYLDFKHIDGHPGHPYFCRKDLNWYGRPLNIYQVRDFIETPFDLLMNIFDEIVPPLEYIACLSPAKCRIGKYFQDKEFCNEIMVDVGINTKGIDKLSEQILHYAKMIKNE